MNPLVFSVEEGIELICKKLLPKSTTATRNGLLEMSYKLSIGAITSIALTTFDEDGPSVFIISDNDDQRSALLEQFKDSEFDLLSEPPTERKSAQVFAFPSVAPRTTSGA